MAFVRAIVQACEHAGIAPQPLLQQAQIAPETVANPDARVTAWQFERLSGLAMQALDDEALGWFARRLPWGSYGMLARASISAPELGLALARWCRHHGLLTQSIELQLSEQGDTATLSLREVEPLGAMREFCMISVLRNIHGLASWLVNQPIDLLQAQFPFPAPAHSDVYAVLFAPGQLQFDAPIASLQFSAHWLRTSRPIKRVALACGFLNDKSFIRAFKMWTGLSPAEFRRTARMP